MWKVLELLFWHRDRTFTFDTGAYTEQINASSEDLLRKNAQYKTFRVKYIIHWYWYRAGTSLFLSLERLFLFLEWCIRVYKIYKRHIKELSYLRSVEFVNFTAHLANTIR